MDSAPILLVPDALALAAHADAVLLVLRVGATSRDVATAAVQQIAHVGGRLVGTVLNDPDGKSERKEQYGYGYGYTHAS